MSDINDEDGFNALAILHAENGSLEDRTIRTGSRAPNFATRQICAQVDSLSPFQLATKVNAAKAMISGLLLDDLGATLPFTRVRLGGAISKDGTELPSNPPAERASSACVSNDERISVGWLGDGQACCPVGAVLLTQPKPSPMANQRPSVPWRKSSLARRARSGFD